jgi:hypothetical protein
VALGFLWSALFIPQPGSLTVLDRVASHQDVMVGDYGPVARDMRTEDARFLGTYHNSDYFVAPGTYDETTICLITKSVVDDGVWAANCGFLIDGRDMLTNVSDAEGRMGVLVPDQFDHRTLEAEGWVSVHQNLLVQPK